jgi:hypothetical protein
MGDIGMVEFVENSETLSDVLAAKGNYCTYSKKGNIFDCFLLINDYGY